MLYKNLIFILFIEIIRAFIISGFASTFLNKNGKTFLRTGAYSLSITITAFLYAAFNNSVLNVLSKVLGLSVISLAYRGKIKNRCLFVLYVMAVGCMMDLLVYAVLSKTPDYNNYSSYASILSLLLLLVAESVTKRLFGNDGKAELSNRSWLLYTIFLLVCVLTTLFIAMDKAISSLTLTVVCGAILVVNVIIAYLIDDLIRLSRDALENQALNDQIRAYEREMNFQDQRLEDLRSFKHDIKRHFSEITALADTGNTREIKRYMSELDNYINKSPVIVDSGNTVIDTVLNYMLRRAADKNIQVITHVVVPKELELSAFLHMI